MSDHRFGTPVADPREIERELVRIWREAAAVDASRDSGDPAPRMRAVLSNLILLTDAHGQNDLVERVITELSITHPSRFFVVRLFEDRLDQQTDPLETAVSSRCVLANSGAHVCSEEVYISAEFRAATLVPNLLTSLFIADVPVILVFLSDPSTVVEPSVDISVKQSGREALRQLIAGVSRLCDRIVYDSALFSHYGRDLGDLISFGTFLSRDPGTGRNEACIEVGAKKNIVQLRDTNWQRLKRWRVLIAEQFSNKRFHDVEGKILSLELRFSPQASLSSSVPSEAVLLTAWFSSCLNWRFVQAVRDAGQEGDMILLFQRGGGADREVTFRRISADSGIVPGAVWSVGIAIDDLEIPHIRIERGGGDDTFTVIARAGERAATRRVPSVDEPLEKLMLSDVIGGRGDEDFARVLVNSLELARGIEGQR